MHVFDGIAALTGEKLVEQICKRKTRKYNADFYPCQTKLLSGEQHKQKTANFVTDFTVVCRFILFLFF